MLVEPFEWSVTVIYMYKGNKWMLFNSMQIILPALLNWVYSHNVGAVVLEMVVAVEGADFLKGTK